MGQSVELRKAEDGIIYPGGSDHGSAAAPIRHKEIVVAVQITTGWIDEVFITSSPYIIHRV
jgi:hypothetical protein